MTVPTDINWKASVGKLTTLALRRFKPAVHEAIQSQLRGGNVKTINVTLSFDFIPDRAEFSQRALSPSPLTK